MSTSRSTDNSSQAEFGEGTSGPDHRPDRDSDHSPEDQSEQEYSDLVNVLGIITIVFGALKLLCGVGLSSGLAFYSTELKEMLGEVKGVDSSIVSVLILAIVVLFLIIPGLLQIIGGTGLLKRKNWARILMIVLGGLDVFFALPQLLGGNLIGFAITGGLGGFTLFVLLSDPYQKEFSSRGTS